MGRAKRDWLKAAPAVVVALLFWFAHAAMHTLFFHGRSFFAGVVAPSAEELLERLLVIVLAGALLFCSSRAGRVRDELEHALSEALSRAEWEKAKVVAVVEAMGDAISLQDTRFTVLYQNKAHQGLAGNQVGRACYAAFRGKREVCGDCHLVESFRDGSVHRAELEMTLGGSIRQMEITASPVKDPDGLIVAGIQVWRDITDRKRAEQAARDEAALLQHLIDVIPSPIYHQDLRGRFLWCNAAFASWLGVKREFLVGRGVNEIASERICQFLRDRDPEEGEREVTEGPLKWMDGELRDVILYRSMFSDSSGARGGLVGAMIDITERKRAEQEVFGLNAALMQQAYELNLVNRDLKAFSQAISHDLRTPLTRIYSSGQALEEYAPQLDQIGRFFVKTINDGCVQVEALLDALLGLSRVTEVQMAREPVDLSALALEKAQELKLANPGRSVTFNIAPDLQAQGDPSLFGIMLDNLIGNAWKFTACVAEPVIEFGSYLSPEGETVYFLKDNGAGFDAPGSEKLFQPFQRLHPSQQFPGSGLGLATVRRVIMRHNGRIWGEAEPGRGATFHFTLEA